MSIIFAVSLAVAVLAPRATDAQTTTQDVTNSTSATLTTMGYNETGFEDTTKVFMR